MSLVPLLRSQRSLTPRPAAQMTSASESSSIELSMPRTSSSARAGRVERWRQRFLVCCFNGSAMIQRGRNDLATKTYSDGAEPGKAQRAKVAGERVEELESGEGRGRVLGGERRRVERRRLEGKMAQRREVEESLCSFPLRSANAEAKMTTGSRSVSTLLTPSPQTPRPRQSRRSRVCAQ